MLGIKHLVHIGCQQNEKYVNFVGGDSTRNKDSYQQSRVRMTGVKTTVSYIHIGFIVSPTVTCRVPMISIPCKFIENTSAKDMIQGGLRGGGGGGSGAGVWMPPKICQIWGPLWKFNG